MTKRLLALIVKEVVRQGNASLLPTTFRLANNVFSTFFPTCFAKTHSKGNDSFFLSFLLFNDSFSFINIYREPILLGKMFATDFT